MFEGFSTMYQYITHNSLTEFTAIIVMVVIMAGIMRALKQPMIIAYILAGVILGPAVLDVVHHEETVDIFSHMGIGLLLFMVGLGLNPAVIKAHGKVALIAGTLQIAATAALGYGISMLLGLDHMTSLYIGAGMTFSSTIVIVKLLSDKDDVNSLYGRIATGVLIIQDIAAMVLLMTVSLGNQAGGGDVSVFLLIAKAVGLIGGLYLISRYVLPKIMDDIARSSEFLLLFGLARCFLLGSLFDYAGFGLEIGTLLAGMSLAMSPYKIEIEHKLSSLRDFFLVEFFILVGMDIVLGDIAGKWHIVIILSLLVLLVKPLIVMTITRVLGYTDKTAIKAGLSLGQISEFSFLLVGLGITAGHIQDPATKTVIMLVGLITIFGSAYVTMYNEQLFQLLERLGIRLNHHDNTKRDLHQTLSHHEIILYGYGRMGSELGVSLRNQGIAYAVVDHDPDAIKHVQHHGVDAVYADVHNIDAYKELLHDDVKMIISSIRDFNDNIALLHAIRKYNSDIISVMVAESTGEAIALYEQGAHYVILPHELSAHHTTTIIQERGFDVSKFVDESLGRVEKLRG